MIYRRDLINKRTNEVVLKSINYVYDFADNIYYVSDQIVVPDVNQVINVIFTLDDEYKPNGVVFNDRFDDYSLLGDNVQESYDQYKASLIERAKNETLSKYDKFYDTNDKFIKMRKRKLNGEKRKNGSN
jgi:hypothetical protein